MGEAIMQDGQASGFACSLSTSYPQCKHSPESGILNDFIKNTHHTCSKLPFFFWQIT